MPAGWPWLISTTSPGWITRVAGLAAGVRPAWAAAVEVGSAPFTLSRTGIVAMAAGKFRATRWPSVIATGVALLAWWSDRICACFLRPPSLAAWPAATSFTLALMVDVSAARAPVSPPAVMVAAETISALAVRAIRFVAMKPPKLREPALVVVPLPATVLSGVLPASWRALSMTTALSRFLIAAAAFCSGVRTVTVLLTVALTVPALAALTPTAPDVAMTVAPSIRARIACVASAVKKLVPSTASRAVPTILSAMALVAMPVRP
ncbi:hypothetical protein GCM10007888_17850 [Methylobacterium oxalidis]|uniref:ComEC/Rec2-related protein domain-containing protein n=1 Tax=Methylobacterium oxalidis TaxID=944322 RepID=A0ABQ6DEY4_9HYPH|nr:hypothetical protein LDDCCGHA_3257 [Methylobacterium oxalidis]GLS63404.1 hypothetical protein GCM10007888_17850 [Methylobacterium oxalidis]